MSNKKAIKLVQFDSNAWNLDRFKRITAHDKSIQSIFNEAVKEASVIAVNLKVDQDKPFSFSDYPQTNARVNKLFSGFSNTLTQTINDQTKVEWLSANAKNDALVSALSSEVNLSKAQLERYSQRNLEALKSFQTRKKNGIGLSERVWNLKETLRSELEMGIDIALAEGRSAQQLSQDLRGFLQEPDKLFRRVRDKRGVLRPSKNMKAYKTGAGVYKSSYKNAMRLARTETNMAYLASDNARWKQLDFVVGFEVVTSNNHPMPDICDHLKGKYPKSFVFTGWHPQCRCHCISILAPLNEFDKAETDLLNGKDISDYQYSNEVKSVPTGFTNWIKANEHRVTNATSIPYFISDNKALVKSILPTSDAKQIVAQNAKYDFDEVESKIEMDKLYTRDNVPKSGLTNQGYIGEIQGFNGLPQLVDNTQFDALVKNDNYMPIYRGFRENGDELVSNFKNGKLYEGLGAYGNGSYFGTTESLALSYTSDNNRNHIISAVFDKSKTKVADYDELRDLWYKDREDNLGNFSESAKKHFNSPLSKIPPEQLDNFEATKKAIYNDFGSWCTAKGYDMIYVKSEDFYVMLNRTKLIVKQ